MDDELRARLADVLAAPDDLKPRLVLADWLEACSDLRAGNMRKHCETGFIYLGGYCLSGDGTGLSPSVVFAVLQLIPQAMAVEFGCRCADRVLPMFHQEWPNDARPRQLVAAVRDWLRGEQTKKCVHQLAWGMADVVDEQAAQPPAGVVWDDDRERQCYAAVCAARSAVNVAAAVEFPAASDRWVSEICQSAIEAINASAEKDTGSRRCERDWQLQDLIELLKLYPNSRNCNTSGTKRRS